MRWKMYLQTLTDAKLYYERGKVMVMVVPPSLPALISRVPSHIMEMRFRTFSIPR